MTDQRLAELMAEGAALCGTTDREYALREKVRKNSEESRRLNEEIQRLNAEIDADLEFHRQQLLVIRNRLRTEAEGRILQSDDLHHPAERSEAGLRSRLHRQHNEVRMNHTINHKPVSEDDIPVEDLRPLPRTISRTQQKALDEFIYLVFSRGLDVKTVERQVAEILGLSAAEAELYCGVVPNLIHGYPASPLDDDVATVRRLRQAVLKPSR